MDSELHNLPSTYLAQLLARVQNSPTVIMNSTTPEKAVQLSIPDTSTQGTRITAKPITNRPKYGSASSEQFMKEDESCTTCAASDHNSNFCPKKSSTTSATPSSINTPHHPPAPVPQQDFQRVWPRPAVRFPIRYPGGSVFREEMDVDASHQSLSCLRGLPKTTRVIQLQTNRGMSVQKDCTPSCMTSLTSMFASLLTPAQSEGAPPSAKVEVDLMKPLLSPPGNAVHQSPEPQLRPQPTTFRNITFVPLSSLGQEDPYRDIQRRSNGVRMSHVPGGLADEYFFPEGTQARTEPTRRIAPARTTRSPLTQTKVNNNKSAPQRPSLLPLAPSPPYPTNESSILSSSHCWIPILPALPAPADCTNVQTPPGPGIKIWTEKGPLVVECGVRPAKALEQVERFSVLVWEELGEREDTDEARRWDKMTHPLAGVPGE